MASTIVCIQRAELGYSANDVAKAIFYFLSTDSNTEEPADYPINKPELGTAYSYEVWLAFRCDVAPSSYVNNFKIWTLESLGTGQNITINSSAVSSYATPSAAESVQGSRADITDYNAGNKLSIAGTLNNVADLTDFMVFQLEIVSTVTTGVYTGFTILYEYDEV